MLIWRKRENCLIIESASREETFDFGVNIGRNAIPGMVITLAGPLGAGKTVLAKGIACGLGISDEVTSPSFTLINEYKGRVPLYHIDLYRLSDTDEVHELGLDEIMEAEGVCVIEWWQCAQELLPVDRVSIDIRIGRDNIRRITLEGIKLE